MSEGLHSEIGEGERQEILQRRARDLAMPAVPDMVDTEGAQVVTFRVLDDRYALPVKSVEAIEKPARGITPVPCTPPFVAGLANLRGSIIPVLDLPRLLGGAEVPNRPLGRVIIVAGAGIRAGILADEVLGLARLSMSSIASAEASAPVLREEYLTGVTQEGTLLLDVDSLLGDPRLQVDQGVA